MNMHVIYDREEQGAANRQVWFGPSHRNVLPRRHKPQYIASSGGSNLHMPLQLTKRLPHYTAHHGTTDQAVVWWETTELQMIYM